VGWTAELVLRVSPASPSCRIMALVRTSVLVTLAPFLQEPVPANVLRAMNFYQSPGWGAPLTTAEGFHGKLLNIDVSNDWTITHISID
jgi:hypothetical protein